ncbi:MAG: winged helix-turn-helix domain-containing protein, partial [Burkholderiaceae bacterium]
MSDSPLRLTAAQGRRIWLRAQRLDRPAPFGAGAAAVAAAVEHLGYVQIDTIHVIERCHHHILWSRIPDYRRADLRQAQSVDKSVFEYWTHALAYVPTRDLPYFLPEMKRRRAEPSRWHASVTPQAMRKVLTLIRREGPISIRDIDDDELVEKTHLWASRKPSKRALQRAFFDGRLTISERIGMLKRYELFDRHFDWDAAPRPAGARQLVDYRLERALRAQGLISLDSACYLEAGRKPAMLQAIAARVKRSELRPVQLDGAGAVLHWAEPASLEQADEAIDDTVVHLLSPFDPLVIQRRRLQQFFGYEHLFEAYVPAHKRRFGYFALPVLAGDQIVAAIDLKADRGERVLRIQNWTWVGQGRAGRHKRL